MKISNIIKSKFNIHPSFYRMIQKKIPKLKSGKIDYKKLEKDVKKN